LKRGPLQIGLATALIAYQKLPNHRSVVLKLQNEITRFMISLVFSVFFLSCTVVLFICRVV